MNKERVILERRYIPKGTILIKQGDEAFAAYLLQSGRVHVYKKEHDKRYDLSELGPGEICGEMALFNDEPRNANVEAIEDCNVIVLTRGALEEKIKNTDPTIAAVMRMLIKRIKHANNKHIATLEDKE